MATWTKQSLFELGEVNRGKSKHRPRNDAVLYGGKYPFIQTSDIKHSNFYITKYNQTYNENGLKQSKLWPKNTLCITIAANIAESGILVFPACFPDSVVGFVSDEKKSNVKFVKYALDYSKKNFQKTAKGTAQDNLSLDKIKSIKIDAPEISEQNKIADVISAYDELIENNERRIKILEETAQRLYTEWFVKFNLPAEVLTKAGFPDGKLKMIDSGTEYGMIPEGWATNRLRDVTNYVRGCSYSSDEIDDYIGEYYIVNLKSFNRGGGFRFDGAKYYTGDINENQLLSEGDIVVAVTDMTNDRAIIARPARIPEIKHRTTFSADVVKIISDNLPNSFIYQLLSSYRFTETTKQKANGANVLHLKPDAILEYKALIPTKELLNEFEAFCSKTTKEINKLIRQNDILTKTRDLLIPQLVTGRRYLK